MPEPALTGFNSSIGEFVADEPIPVSRVLLVNIQGHVDQVRIVPIPPADRVFLPLIEHSLRKTQHRPGHHDRNPEEGHLVQQGQGPASKSFWVNLPGQVGHRSAHHFHFLLQQANPFLRLPQLKAIFLGETRGDAVLDIGFLQPVMQTGFKRSRSLSRSDSTGLHSYGQPRPHHGGIQQDRA